MMRNKPDIEMASHPTGDTRKFARDIIWIAVAQLFSSVILGIVTLPALTKSYSTEIFGIWSQAYVTVALLSPIFCIEFDMAVVRFLAGETDKTRIRQALGSMLFTILGFSAVTYAIINLLAPQLSVFLFASPEYTVFVRLTFLWVIFNALFVFFSAYLRAQKRNKLISVRSVMLNVIIMALVIGMASQKIGLEWIIGSVALVHAVIALIFFVMIVREIGWPLPNTRGLKSYLAFSLPQIPAVVLLWLVSSSDRYFITHLLGLSQAGIYSSSNQLASMTRIFYSPVTYVLYPTLSALWDKKKPSEVKSYLEHSTRLLLTLGIPAAAGIALLSQPLLKLLTTTEFLAGNGLVFLISIGAIFLGIHQINGHIILLEKRTRLMPAIIAAASVVSVILNVILIPRIGILGAGISNISSYFVLAVIATIWVGKSIGYHLDLKYIAKVIGATIPMAVCLYFWNAEDLWSILLSILTGAAIFAAGLFLLRAFSERDKRLIKGTLGGLVPAYLKKRG